MAAVFETMCPGDAGFLANHFCSTTVDDSPVENTTLFVLKEIYSQAESWTLQRQILSIIVQEHKFDDVKEVHIYISKGPISKM